MTTIALAHTIDEEIAPYIDKLPIDEVKAYCKTNGFQIADTYYDEDKLINDIKNSFIQPTQIVFFGDYDSYPDLDTFCQNTNIEFISTYPNYLY